MLRHTAWPLLAATLVLGANIGQANAAFVTFFDKTGFLTTTGAAHVAEPNIQFSPGPDAAIIFGQWSSRLPTNKNVALNGTENLNVALTSSVFAFGFDFVEPQFDGNVNGPFIESAFSVRLLNQATEVASFTFSAPNDAAYFVGAQTDAAFNKVEIREIVGSYGNEFFGKFYTSSQAYPTEETSVSVPEPASLALLGLGLTGLTIASRRRRT